MVNQARGKTEWASLSFFLWKILQKSLFYEELKSVQPKMQEKITLGVNQLINKNVILFFLFCNVCSLSGF